MKAESMYHYHQKNVTTKSIKGSQSGRKKMIPNENMDQQEGRKSPRYGKYDMGK